MKNASVAAMLAGSTVALSHDHAAHMLALDLPEAARQAADGGKIQIEPGDRFGVADGLAVVPVKGLLTPNFYRLERYMGWTTYHGLAETMAELSQREDVRGIVLEVDSPGGMVLGIEAAVQAIAAAAKVKKVHALVHPLAASAAYWLASQASEMVLTPGSVVGSIGTAVNASSFVQPGGFDGSQLYSFTSSQADAKRPDPASEKGATELRRGLDEVEARFHADVAAGRNIVPAQLAAQLSVTDDPADGGAVFSAGDAIARGLADRTMSRADFYAEVGRSYAPATSNRSMRGYRAQAEAALAVS
jgi:ClpP class serine protease